METVNEHPGCLLFQLHPRPLYPHRVPITEAPRVGDCAVALGPPVPGRPHPLGCKQDKSLGPCLVGRQWEEPDPSVADAFGVGCQDGGWVLGVTVPVVREELAGNIRPRANSRSGLSGRMKGPHGGSGAWPLPGLKGRQASGKAYPNCPNTSSPLALLWAGHLWEIWGSVSNRGIGF